MLKVVELFSGIGAYSKALENLKIKHEVVAAVEFDKKTMDCYNLIHGTDFSPMDITKLTGEELPDCDMICYSPPCQSYSAAGKNGGTSDPRGTLFWDALRIIKAKKPRYCLMENVKNLTGKKHKETFDTMLKELEDAGYSNYWKVLNSKNYGVPQNRERVFVVSIRKDIEKDFEFPQPFDNGIRLKDLLETEVDEKYYISNEKCQKLLEQLKDKEISNAVRNGGRGSLDRHCWDAVCVPNEISVVGRIDLNGNDICKRVYSPGGSSATIPTGSSGNTMPKVLLDYRIRKITPLECFRLQSFSDSDYYVLHDNGISNSQIYKVAGNSIAVCVLEAIFKELLCLSIAQKL